MLRNLPSAIRDVPGLLDHLERMEFDQFDISYYLQQNQWLHDVAERVVREKPSPALAGWLKEIEATSGIASADKLAKAERLFDWTIRNIQLDPLLPPPKPPVATANPSKAQQEFESWPAPRRGEPGPGYQDPPLQTLLFGHGDAWQRGRIFILLCRQLGIDAVMLGVVDETSSSGAQPWAAAVLLDQQLFLFDPALGLPIPGPDRHGIATLEQAIAQPGLLAQLNLQDGAKYSPQQEQLTNIVALIDAEPHALSRRMGLLERSLKGNRYLGLVVAPSKLEKSLRDCKHFSTVSLWRVPFEALLYQTAKQQRLQSDPAMQMEYQREMTMFQPQHPIMQARNLHFQGIFADVDQAIGARTLYLQARAPDREIDMMQTSNLMRERSGLAQRLPEDPKQRDAMLDMLAFVARRSKQHASYWLALTYADSGKYDAAIEWLEQRTIPGTPPTPWMSGAKYNLARIYEARGETAKAQQLYESDVDSPQRHGNLLRAQWLSEKQKSSKE